jgi:hypothetical protein
VEHPRIADDDLTDVLGLDITEVMEMYEARPISMFACVAPTAAPRSRSETGNTSCGSLA